VRLDPGDRRIATARSFEVCEGGGEYNVARGLKRCFGLNTAVVTAFTDDPVGRLSSGSHLPGRRGPVAGALGGTRWRGPRGAQRPQFYGNAASACVRALGSYDRGHTAVSQFEAGRHRLASDFWKSRGARRWFHTGGIFCALSETTPEVTLEAIEAARRNGTIVSYDLNYRASLWKSHGGKKKQAQEVNRRIAPHVDVMLGNEGRLLGGAGLRRAGNG